MKQVQHCPFCDFTSKFPRGVVRHFLREHSRHAVVGLIQAGDTWDTSKAGRPAVFCWCRKWFYHRRRSRGPTAWERHLYAKGGLFQHVFAVALEGKL